ncbi:MAG TPA: ROK family protein, partial [Methylotenera sp.]|nr:ROK family protein [Methylotenera sp.]
MALLIGIDVGGTNLRLGVVQYNEVTFDHASAEKQPRFERLKLLDEMRFQADFSSFCKAHEHEPDQAWHKILSTIAAAINAVRTKYPEVAAVGIGFPGFIDPYTQKISLSPNLPGLTNVDLSADLSAIIDLPVITENDALAAAYGEFATAMQPVNNLIYLGLGTGVGGGLILNQQPFQGQHGVAMEVGHIIVEAGGRLCGCGNRGCMEQYASASGVSLSYLDTSGNHCTAAEIAALANAGDQHALAAYRLAGDALAQALAHILKVIDVTDIVIGGGMSASWHYMQQAFQKRLQQDLIPALRDKVNVRISDLDDEAGIIGATMLAHRKL